LVHRVFGSHFTWLVLAGLLASVVLGERVPAGGWAWAPLLALTVPLWLLLLAGLALGKLLRRRWLAVLLPLAGLVLAWPQVQRGLPLHLATAQPAGPGPSLRLLSANVRIFNVYPQLRRLDPSAPAKAITWLAASQVMALAGTHSADGHLYRVADRLGVGSGRQVFVSKTLTNSIGAQFGLAIFSRLPIVGRGEISFGRLTQNHAMWVDVAGPGRGDTVRIFNTHLQSMSLDEGDIVAAGSSRAGLKSKGRGLLRRFVRGAAARAWQADTLVAHVRRSPYPVLLAGDLNDLPYSYAYAQLANDLQNAWATVGFGPGNTYHGRLPPFLRIDQQFAGPQWQVLDCRIHTEIPYADHFPVEGLYQLRRGRE
jgi:endonuclease/exonuclease/phosphatase family metal-dependent hydrolase